MRLTPSSCGFDVIRPSSNGRWWLIGSIEGDQPLPQTSNAHTLPEALDMAEAWLAPEIERLMVTHE